MPRYVSHMHDLDATPLALQCRKMLLSLTRVGCQTFGKHLGPFFCHQIHMDHQKRRSWPGIIAKPLEIVEGYTSVFRTLNERRISPPGRGSIQLFPRARSKFVKYDWDLGNHGECGDDSNEKTRMCYFFGNPILRPRMRPVFPTFPLSLMRSI